MKSTNAGSKLGLDIGNFLRFAKKAAQSFPPRPFTLKPNLRTNSYLWVTRQVRSFYTHYSLAQDLRPCTSLPIVIVNVITHFEDHTINLSFRKIYTRVYLFAMKLQNNEKTSSKIINGNWIIYANEISKNAFK